MADLPRSSGNVKRQRLAQRDSSKDSAFDGSTVSSMGLGDDENAEAKNNGHINNPLPTRSMPPSTGIKAGTLPTNKFDPAASPVAIPKTSPMLVTAAPDR